MIYLLKPFYRQPLFHLSSQTLFYRAIHLLADYLDMHHSTVLRRINALEKSLKARLWLVAHRDVHRTSKVQVFNQFIKDKLVF